MPVYLLKSLLSIVVALSTLLGMFTMFELYGRNERKYDPEKLRSIHRLNGYFYLLLYIVVAYLCIKVVMGFKAPLSPRATMHSLLSLSVILLIALKIAINRVYRGFYGQLKTLGLVLSLLSFGMIGSSGGYYLVATKLGTDLTVQRTFYKGQEAQDPQKTASLQGFRVREDAGSIAIGRELYEDNCSLCHDPHSNDTIVGPGHKGILKNPRLPVSGKPATPENVRNQMLHPYSQMPSFDYLTEEEIAYVIAYLNTL